MKYVVYWCERLRDGVQEGARVVSSVGEGLEKINRIRGGFVGGNCTFKMFELGRELPLTEETVKTPQPPLAEVKIRLAAPETA